MNLFSGNRRSVVRSGVVVAALGMLFIFSQYAGAADDYGTWSNWRYIYLITNSSGAKVTTGNVYNVPVLIRLNPSNFDGFGHTSNPADIRFSKADGTHLFYEIERWTGTSSANATAE